VPGGDLESFKKDFLEKGRIFVHVSEARIKTSEEPDKRGYKGCVPAGGEVSLKNSRRA